MNQSADAADQIVRMSLNGTEVALRIAGKGSKEAAILLIKAIRSAHKQTNKTKGEIRLDNLIRSGRKLDIARISDTDLKQFCSEAKKYGILYTVLKNRNSKNGVTEIMFKSDDREKFNMIFAKLGKDPSYLAQVKETLETEISEKTRKPPAKTTKDADRFVDELMKKPEDNTVSAKDGVHKADPPMARTTQSSRSEPSSDTQSKTETADSPVSEIDYPVKKKSVRKELDEIKAEMEKKAQNKNRQKTKTLTHKNPGRKKKLKKSRER